MSLLQLVYRLEVTIQIGSRIRPRVTRIVNVLVRPEVGKENFAGVRADICEGVKYVTAWKGVRLILVVTRAMRV